MNDPEYIARIKSLNLDRYTRSGAETQDYITKVMSNSAAVAQEFKQLVDAN
jgi:hypothetical protein